jgi:hypothetical protein
VRCELAAPANSRYWHECMVRSRVARGSSKRNLRSCPNVSGLELELICSGPSWISARNRSHEGECLDRLNVPGRRHTPHVESAGRVNAVGVRARLVLQALLVSACGLHTRNASMTWVGGSTFCSSELTSAELSQALQDARSAAEKQAVRRH